MYLSCTPRSPTSKSKWLLKRTLREEQSAITLGVLHDGEVHKLYDSVVWCRQGERVWNRRSMRPCLIASWPNRALAVTFTMRQCFFTCSPGCDDALGGPGIATVKETPHLLLSACRSLDSVEPFSLLIAGRQLDSALEQLLLTEPFLEGQRVECFGKSNPGVQRVFLFTLSRILLWIQ